MSVISSIPPSLPPSLPPSSDLLLVVEGGAEAALLRGLLQDGVRDGRVAVGADVGVPLLLVPRVPHLWNVDPLLRGDTGQGSLDQGRKSCDSHVILV